MGLKIRNIKFEGFRAFRELRIDGLGRVNLITGMNNTGKSSVLEGLRILAHDAAPEVIYDILRYREEDFEEGVDGRRLGMEIDDAFLASTLFHGFPQLSESMEPIVISTDGEPRGRRLEIRVEWYSEEIDSEGNTRLVEQRSNLFGEYEGTARLVIQRNGQKRFMRRIAPLRFGSLNSLKEDQVRCVFVSPGVEEGTGQIVELWDAIELSDYEESVVEALQIIDPGIIDVAMVGINRYRSPRTRPRELRTAMVRAKNVPRRIPLRSYGDGLNRLFSIALSLVNARGGLLLIDEFENGLHHTVQLDTWRMVFSLAEELDIQVFATSHSRDAVEAFQKAADESAESGVLVRLARSGEDVLSTVLSEAELSIATRHGIEAR